MKMVTTALLTEHVFLDTKQHLISGTRLLLNPNTQAQKPKTIERYT